MKKWIVIATRADARIFFADDLSLIVRLANPIGREKSRALSDDKPGSRRAKFIGGSSLYNLTGEKDPHEDAAIAFAKRINTFLQKHLNLNHFAELLIVAEPKMLGRLKSEMSKELLRVAAWEAKDFGKLRAHELRQRLAGSR